MTMCNTQNKWEKINVSVPALLPLAKESVFCSHHSQLSLHGPWPCYLSSDTPTLASILLPILSVYTRCCLDSFPEAGQQPEAGSVPRSGFYSTRTWV